MKKIFLLTSLFFVFSLSLLAKSVDPATAKTAAKNFVLHQTQTLLKTIDVNLVYTLETNDPAVLSKTGTQSEAVYYIFNINQTAGFIIMAADDAATPVLGYSNTSGYTGQNMPPALVKLLEKYKQEIIFIKQNSLVADTKLSRDWYQLTSGKFIETRSGSAVAPLCSTTWDQMPYYNALCPYDNTYGQRTVTGCAATAMAQIMKFWNYPANGTGFYSYSHNTYGTLSANFGNTSYAWGSMSNHLTGANTAVATLMYHCGVSIDMDYGVASQGGSGAYVISSASPVTNCVEYALKTYFGYNSATLQGLERKNYTDAVWIQKLKNDLDAGQPIQYAGFGQGGHTFVCDGYDNTNKFHFNWGWGGMYDGYFDINSLNPGSGGTGGGAGTYNNGQQALFGIKPITGGGGSASLEIYSTITCNPYPINYAMAFDITVSIANTSSTNVSNDSFAAAIFTSSGVFLDFVAKVSGAGLNPLYYRSVTFSNTGLVSATPGSYIIGIYSKASGSSWKLIPAGSYANAGTVSIVGPANDLSLYDSIVPTPRIIVQKQAVSIHTNIANYGSTAFNGDISIDLHDLDGKWIANVDLKTGLNLNALSYWTGGITFTSTGLNVDPGNYLLVIWDKPSSTGTWEILGSGSYANPVTVRIVVPSITPDPYERNNTVDSAYTLPVTFVANSATVKTTGSNIHVGQDYDFYKINLPSGYTYTITARVHDKYNSGDGNTYTADVLFSYKKGTGWSDSYDDIMPGPFTISNGDPLIIYVAPYFLGNTGTYLLDISITRSIAPNISITSPISTTDWKKGSTQNITWTDNITENVIIELYKGTSQLLTINPSAPSNGSYSWTLPGTLTPANDYNIKITSTSDNSIKAYSSYFTISEIPSISITSPTTGTDWKKNSVQSITWTDNIADNVIIELYKGTSQLLTINTSTASSGTYSWTLPATLTASNDYRIKITSTADNSINTFSNYFTISEPNSIGTLAFSNHVSVYPNPASSALYISFGNNSGFNTTVKITNCLGEVVYTNENVAVTNGSIVIDISGLKDGLYFINILNEGKYQVKSFIKKGN